MASKALLGTGGLTLEAPVVLRTYALLTARHSRRIEPAKDATAGNDPRCDRG